MLAAEVEAAESDSEMADTEQTPLTPEDINRLRAVGKAATEGPWVHETWHGWCVGAKAYGPDHCAVWKGDLLIATTGEQGDEDTHDDAEFITQARNEWNRLLDEVEVLRAAIREHVIGVDGATIHERDCYLHPDSVWKGRRDYCSCEHNSLAALVRGREQTNG